MTTGGVSMTRLIKSLVAGFRMAFDTATSGNPEKMFERLFDVLAQPGELHGKSTPQDAGGPASPPADTSSSTTHDVDADKADDSETRILRTGFHEFLNYAMTLRTQLSDLSEGVTQLTSMKSPNEYQAFLKRAMNTTGERRLCVTRTGRIGVVPKRTRVGDSVAVFEGCDIHFVLRRVRGLLGVPEGRYRVVGPAYLNVQESEGGSEALVGGDIEIV